MSLLHVELFSGGGAEVTPTIADDLLSLLRIAGEEAIEACGCLGGAP